MLQNDNAQEMIIQPENVFQAYNRQIGEAIDADVSHGEQIRHELGWKDTPLATIFSTASAGLENNLERSKQLLSGEADLLQMMRSDSAIDKETGKFVDRGRLAETELFVSGSEFDSDDYFER